MSPYCPLPQVKVLVAMSLLFWNSVMSFPLSLDFSNDLSLFPLTIPDTLTQYHHHHHEVFRRSADDGDSQDGDRALGPKKKKDKAKSSNKRTYPWDSKAAKGEVLLTYPESVQQHALEDEEPFAQDYYTDYDFEFAKGMVKNGNWEGKTRDMQEALIED